MKPIDIDRLFEKYLRNVMTKNVGKYTEDEWESKLPALYEKFGDAPLLELDGASPKAYFAALSGKEVVDLLADYVDRQVSVPDYLCEAIVKNEDAEEYLLALIDPETEEELLSYVINLLEERGAKAPLERYQKALFSPDFSDEIKELMIEMLAARAEEVSEALVKKYPSASKKVKDMLLDVIAQGKHSEEAFRILMQAFQSHPENMPLYVQYLIKYGDERALPALYEAIKKPGVDYLSFQELRNAIEALGGEFSEERDFSSDRFYRAMRNAEKKREEEESKGE